MPPATVTFDPAGLQGDVVRGKTTHRRVEVVQFYVSKESKDAWLVQRDWLRVGLQLFSTTGRDASMENRGSRVLLTEPYSIRKDGGRGSSENTPWSSGVDEERCVTTKRVVTTAQGTLANKVKAQYMVVDFLGDKSVLNNFALWLQSVRKMTATEARDDLEACASNLVNRARLLCRW